MYPHQVERLTSALEGAGLGALVATSAANVAYVTGFRGPGGPGGGATPWAIFTRRGTALVVPAAEAAAAVLDGVEADQIAAFGESGASIADGPDADRRRLRSIADACAPTAAEAAARALEILGVSGEAIGLDPSGLSPADWERARTRLGGRAAADGAAPLLGARRVKGPFEIECLERALRIAEEALNEVIQILARGTTEREAVAACRAEMVKRGGDPGRVLAAVGERSGMPLAWPTDRALRAGEVIRFDVGCLYRGYHARVARTAVLGEPTAEHDLACGAIAAGLEVAIGCVRPGRTAGAVFAAAAEAIRPLDPVPVRRSSVGHGIGLEPRESPSLAPDDPTPLEAGEVLQLETAHCHVGAFGCALAETVLVTTAGARVLNRSARGLVTLD